jgi:DNA-binding SARP family transcriptional activator
MVLIRLLGPVEVASGDGWRRAGPPKQSCVLAALALSANRSVTQETLVHRVWGGRAPRSARGGVYGHITRLRALLRGHPGVSLARANMDGYRLNVPLQLIDRFAKRELVDHATAAVNAGDHARAAALWRRVVAMWQGPPLSGVAGGWAQQVRDELAGEQVAELAGLYAAELQLGRHTEVVTELSDAVARHPLAEPLVAHLMLALHRCDRPAEALECFAAARFRLREQLGTDPTVRLTELQQRILRQDPALAAPGEVIELSASTDVPDEQQPILPVIPAQLPADITSFTGRKAELSALSDLAARLTDQEPQSGEVVVAAVDGMAGIGKTTLAVRLAHQLSPDFPDGQLFVDLHGFGDSNPVDPADALAWLLRGLGIPASQIADGVDARSAAFRSELAGRRMLIVLDNAAGEEQVAPLLPGSSCLVIITSRRRLSGLDEAVLLSLDVLQHDCAVQLFQQICGRDLFEAAEAAAVSQIVTLCGRLPLAVRLAAARLRDRRGWTAVDLYERLSDQDRRLGELTAGERSVRAALEVSFRELDGDSRALFTLLGAIPGSDIPLPAAAALAGMPAPATERLLEHLVDVNLLATPSAGRYALHDLVRLYATDKAADSPRRQPALARLHSWYLHSAWAAVTAWNGPRPTLPVPARAAGIAEAVFEDAATARRWLSAERSNLMALIDTAAAVGPYPVAWQLADAIAKYVEESGDPGSARRAALSGLAAAHAAGDGHAEAAMLGAVADCTVVAGDYAAAAEHYRHAIRLATEVGDTALASSLHTSLGGAHYGLGQLVEADLACRQALELSDGSGVESILNGLGLINFERGEHIEAAKYLHQVQELSAHSRHRGRYLTVGNLALVYLELGELDRALRYAEEALADGRAMGSDKFEPMHLTHLAYVHIELGRLDQAHCYATESQQRASTLGITVNEPANVLALARSRRDEPHQYLALSISAVETARRLGAAVQETASLVAQADAYNLLGDAKSARDCAEHALTLAAERQYGGTTGHALTVLARSWLNAAELTRADEVARRALDVHRRTGQCPGEARTLRVLGEIAAGRGDIAAARDQLSQALVIFDAMGTTTAEQVRRQLAHLPA